MRILYTCGVYNTQMEKKYQVNNASIVLTIGRRRCDVILAAKTNKK